MVRKSLISFVLLLLISVFASAQEEIMIENRQADSLLSIFLNKLEQPGTTRQQINDQDPAITRVLRKMFEYQKTRSVQGYRILIYRGQDRTKAFETQADFVDAFGDMNIPVIVQYQEPDFFTLVGAVRTREEAFRLRKLIGIRYQNAYAVASGLRLNELE